MVSEARYLEFGSGNAARDELSRIEVGKCTKGMGHGA